MSQPDPVVQTTTGLWVHSHKLVVCIASSHYSVRIHASASHGHRLIYGDFMVPGADPRVYDECPDMDQLTKIMNDYLGVFFHPPQSPAVDPSEVESPRCSEESGINAGGTAQWKCTCPLPDVWTDGYSLVPKPDTSAVSAAAVLTPDIFVASTPLNLVYWVV